MVSHGVSSFNNQSFAVSPTHFGSGYRAGSAFVGNSGTTHDFAFFVMDDATAVPEPSTLAIFALGMIGLVLRRTKK